jgi:hypothetical protein
METLFERTGSTLTLGDGSVASIPSNISALSILATNRFIPDSDYREDGYIYVNNKPVKKWYKNIDDVKVWFPTMKDIKTLQQRYDAIKKVYDEYWKNFNAPAFEAVMKVKKAHAKITHEFQGEYDPWWLYTASQDSPGQGGISFDWVDKPNKPINLEIGNNYYKTSKRLEQIGGRMWRFRKVLMQAINEKVYEIKGAWGDLLQVKVLDKVYWFQHGKHCWELIAGEGNFKTIEL